MRARQSRSSPDGADAKNPRASRRASRGGEAARKRLSAGISRASVAVKSLPKGNGGSRPSSRAPSSATECVEAALLHAALEAPR